MVREQLYAASASEDQLVAQQDINRDNQLSLLITYLGRDGHLGTL